MADGRPDGGWKGMQCPVCGRILSPKVTEEDKACGISLGMEWMQFRRNYGVTGTWVCGQCAQLAEHATDDRIEGAAGSLCALLARMAGRELVR